MERAYVHAILIGYYQYFKNESVTRNFLKFIFNEKNILLSEEFISEAINLISLYKVIYEMYIPIYNIEYIAGLIQNLSQHVDPTIYTNPQLFIGFHESFNRAVSLLLIPPSSKINVRKSVINDPLVSIYDYYLEGIVDMDFDTTFIAHKYLRLMKDGTFNTINRDLILNLLIIDYTVGRHVTYTVTDNYIAIHNSNQLRIWNLKTGLCELLLFDVDDKYKLTSKELVVLSKDVITVCNFLSGEYRLIQAPGVHTLVSVSHDKIITENYARNIQIWNFTSGALEMTLPLKSTFNTVIFLPNNRLFIKYHTEDDDHNPYFGVWNLNTHALDFSVSEPIYEAGVYLHNVIVITENHELIVWDALTRTSRKIKDYHYPEYRLELFAGGDFSSIFYKDSIVNVINNTFTIDGKVVINQDDPIDQFLIVGDKLLTFSENNILRKWDLHVYECEFTFDYIEDIDGMEKVNDTYFTLDRELWNIDTMKLVANNFQNKSVLPDNTVLIASEDHISVIGTPLEYFMSIEGMRVIPDGRVLIRYTDSIKLLR